MQTTNTMNRLLQVLSQPAIHGKLTATRHALNVVVAAATHHAIVGGGMDAYDAMIEAGKALVTEYEDLKKRAHLDQQEANLHAAGMDV